MGMTVSIEWFVAQNLGMNALTLLLAARLAGIRTGKGRVFAAAALGCAYAVQIQAADLSRALTTLHRASLDPVQIFMTQQKGLYREVEP